MFSNSAPEKPEVPRARTFTSTSKQAHLNIKPLYRFSRHLNKPGEASTERIWYLSISVLPRISGSGTTTVLSNRPGRTSALKEALTNRTITNHQANPLIERFRKVGCSKNDDSVCIEQLGKPDEILMKYVPEELNPSNSTRS